MCSPHNFELAKSYGAKFAWDYHDPASTQSITSYSNKIDRIWDTISLEEAANSCAKILAPGGTYGKFINSRNVHNIHGAGFPREDAELRYTAAITALGDPIEKLGVRIDGNIADLEFHKKWIAAVEPLLAAGEIKPHPIVMHNGFDGILAGLDIYYIIKHYAVP